MHVSDWLTLFESFHGKNDTDAAICCTFCLIKGKIHDLEMPVTFLIRLAFGELTYFDH